MKIIGINFLLQAWWIGFLLTGTMAIIFGIPLLGFANELPGAKERRKDDVLQANHFGTLANQIPTGDSGLIMDSEKENSWKVIAKEYWDLLKNPTFDCLTAIQCTEAFILNGFSAFVRLIFYTVLILNKIIFAFCLASESD